MSIEWTNEQIDEFLEFVLPCDTPGEYQRALVSFARKYARDATIALREGNQLLRRRSNRRTDYEGPVSAESRSHRVGNPWTFVENRVLSWALKDNSESKAEPDLKYLSILFQRTLDEVSNEIKRRRTEKHGIKGFEL